MLDMLEDNLGVDGIGGTALLIWLAMGVLGLIGSMIYIPQKRKQERAKKLYEQRLENERIRKEKEAVELELKKKKAAKERQKILDLQNNIEKLFD